MQPLIGAAIAARLPDPSEPSVVPFGAVAGALIGAAVARLQRLDRDTVRRRTEDGAFFGAAMAMVGYLIGLVASV